MINIYGYTLRNFDTFGSCCGTRYWEADGVRDFLSVDSGISLMEEDYTKYKKTEELLKAIPPNDAKKIEYFVVDIGDGQKLSIGVRKEW